MIFIVRCVGCGPADCAPCGAEAALCAPSVAGRVLTVCAALSLGALVALSCGEGVVVLPWGGVSCVGGASSPTAGWPVGS